MNDNSFIGTTSYGPGSGPIWLDDVVCTGNEATLASCSHLPFGSGNCGHHEDISIKCGSFGVFPSPSPTTVPTSAPTNSPTTSPTGMKIFGVEFSNPVKKVDPTEGGLRLADGSTWEFFL